MGGGSGHGCAESVSVDYGRRDRPSSTRPRCVRCGTVVASDFSRPACAACERPNGAQQTTIAVSRQRHQSRTTSPRATNPRRYLPPTTPIPDTARPPHQSRRRPADGGTHHPHAPNGEGSPAPKFFWGWSGATPRGSHKNFFVKREKKLRPGRCPLIYLPQKFPNETAKRTTGFTFTKRREALR